MVSKAIRLVLFRKVWKVLETQGFCDGWGGMECRRVRANYINSGYPLGIIEFIVGDANAFEDEEDEEDDNEELEEDLDPHELKQLQAELEASRPARIEAAKRRIIEARQRKERP